MRWMQPPSVAMDITGYETILPDLKLYYRKRNLDFSLSSYISALIVR